MDEATRRDVQRCNDLALAIDAGAFDEFDLEDAAAIWRVVNRLAELEGERDEAVGRAKETGELLRSACAIAERKGEGTSWERFIYSVRKLGLNGITARTYRVLPHEQQDTTQCDLS